MLFSFVIPVYKVELFLNQCIESILNQKFKNFEMILVNDGSPDNSGKICDFYAQQDSRIKVIHKKNEGVSIARNVGMIEAKGTYVWFIDSDDYMVEDVLTKISDLLLKNPDIDMLTCPHINQYLDDKENDIDLINTDKTMQILTRDEYYNILYASNGAYWAPWKNIYKLEILQSNNLLFNPNLNCAEDAELFLKYITKGNKYYILNEPTIHYRIDRVGSVTNTMNPRCIKSQLSVFSSSYFEQKHYNQTLEKQKRMFFAKKYANTVFLLSKIQDIDIINELEREILKNKIILRDACNLRYLFSRLSWFTLGYYKGSLLLQKIKDIFKS